MKKQKIVIFLLCFALSKLYAQTPIQITEATPQVAVGGGKVLYQEDKQHNLSLKAFQAIPDKQLNVYHGKYTHFGITTSAFWIKFKLINTSQQAIYLRINNPMLDTACLYVYRQGALIMEKNVLAQKPEFSLPNAPFSLPAGKDTLTYYIRMTAKVPFLAPIHIIQARDMVNTVFWQAIPDLLFFGAVLIMILYNLVIGISTRNQSYFYYVGYSFWTGLTTFFLKGYPVVFFGKYHFIINDYFAAIASLASIFLVLFTIDFLQLKKNYPRGYALSKIAIYAQSFAIFVFLIGFVNLNVILYQIFNIYNNILVAVIGFRLYKTYQPARIFLVAFLIFVILSTVVNLTLANLITFMPIALYSLHIGTSIELILFSIALADKINMYKKEKEQAQRKTIDFIKEQNTLLEDKVKERTKELQHTNEELNTTLELVESERAKSDKLLLNILPLETAQELKEKGHATPKHYDQITVLFTDFKGFTHLAEKITPEQVIQELDVCFLAFDEICEKYNLEKIKTIGDSYMCAGGLPVANTTNPIDVVSAGLAMQTWMDAWAKEKRAKGQETWELRLGIHTGEAIAGVVGKNKFAYDIWGDTVNLASRMESSGEVGKVNISETTYALVKDKFSCIFRGKISAKNKGEVAMYFVEKVS